MNEAIAKQAPVTSMPKLKEKKKKAMNEIKTKLEAAKLNLIYTELDELGISCNRNYDSVNSLTKDLKRKLNGTDFNKVSRIIQSTNDKLDSVVSKLEAGSTNAFTKLMTSDLSKTIGKTLGISLAGRTALLLAPTIGTKALVATALGGYGMYRIVKNRKEIIKVNENNELNNILYDLEVTKQDGKYVDTRFDKNTQTKIREYLKGIGIVFDDIGYNSLRQKIYSLDVEQKRSLCEYLNVILEKEIKIDKRIEKAKKKLNVVSSTAASMSVGVTMGVNAAAVVNTIDPALIASPVNGSLLSKWISSVSDKKWFSALAGGIGGIATPVLERLPYVGDFFENAFSLQNIATLGTVGAAGGLAVSVGAGLVSAGKSIKYSIKNNKEKKLFLKFDQSKYAEEDKEELKIIADRLKKPNNLIEAAVIDIVYGYLKEENITIEGNPMTMAELKAAIDKLPEEDAKKASNLLKNISDRLSTSPKFVNDLKKAGKISIGLFTAGLAAASVYDIVKSGTFLPELSQTLFPYNNMYAPLTGEADKEYYFENGTKALAKFIKNFSSNHPELVVDPKNGVSQTWIQEDLSKMSAVDLKNISRCVPILDEMIANNEALPEGINADIYSSIPAPLHNVINDYNNFEIILRNKEKFNNAINTATRTIADVSVPTATAAETISLAQKQKTDKDFSVDMEEEIRRHGR